MTAAVYRFPQRLKREGLSVFAISGLDSQVTVTLDNSVYCCADCPLWSPVRDREFSQPFAVYEHLLAHRHCGHEVPDSALAEILEICEAL